MSDDQDVPPLEDCSEFFTTPSSTESTRDQTSTVARTVETPPSVVQGNGSFAGMKKGFLNKAITSKKKASDDIPFIKPSKAAGVSNLRIPEVQEALKTPLLGSTDWITDDLLHKIEANPKLARHFTNPRMAEALQKFQTDQAAAMKQYQNDPEVQEFIQEFCSIMGDHFTKLSNTTKSKPNAAASEEDKRVEELLLNTEVQSVLLDSDIQKFISLLKTDSVSAHRFLSQASAEFKQKVHLLKITETSIPHQAATDGVQYAVSTKVATKDTDNDVNENTDNKEIKYADLQLLPTSSDIHHVTNEGSSPYTELIT